MQTKASNKNKNILANGFSQYTKQQNDVTEIDTCRERTSATEIKSIRLPHDTLVFVLFHFFVFCFSLFFLLEIQTYDVYSTINRYYTRSYETQMSYFSIQHSLSPYLAVVLALIRIANILYVVVSIQ